IDPRVNAVFSGINISANQGYGGGLQNEGKLTLTRSSVANCSAVTGGGIYNTGDLTLLDSTVSGNTSVDGNGGGIYNSGRLTIIDSTLSKNIDTTSYRSFADPDGSAIYNVGL